MGDAIGGMLASALGIAISPLPIVAVVLILATPRAKTNGPAFVLGCWIGIAVVGGAILALAGNANASEDGGPATWVSWIYLILGSALVIFAGKEWRDRPRNGATVPMPKWMEALDTFTAWKSLGTAALLAGINPKNLVLIIAGCSAIAQTGASTGDQAVALLLMVLIGSLGVATPVVLFLIRGEQSRQLLDDLKQWLIANNTVIMSVLFLVIGVMLIGDGIQGLG